MQIIDAHAHIFERLTGFGARGEARAVGGGAVEWATGEREQFILPEHGDTGFSAETLIRLMDEGGVDRAVLLQGSNYGFHNSYVAEAVKKYPTRFVGAGTLDPFCSSRERIFENLTENLGFSIIKLELSEKFGLTGYHPSMRIDGDELSFVFEMAEERGITVTVDIGFIGTSSFQIDGLCRVRDRYPELTIVVAHALFPRPDGRNSDRLKHLSRIAGENIYFDGANLQLHLEEQRDFLRTLIDIVGKDRVAWGTDCPSVFKSRSYKELISDACDRARFSDEELRMLMSENAKAIYRI